MPLSPDLGTTQQPHAEAPNVDGRRPSANVIVDALGPGIHANEHLWDVANALLGEDDPERLPWMVHHTRQLLSEETFTVIEEFRTGRSSVSHSDGACQRCTPPSSAPETTTSPAGENATAFTLSECASTLLSRARSGIAHH